MLQALDIILIGWFIELTQNNMKKILLTTLTIVTLPITLPIFLVVWLLLNDYYKTTGLK